MTAQTITIVAIEDHVAPRWTVALDLPRERLERLFLLSLLDGADFDSMRDAASAVADAVARDAALEATRH